MMKQRKMMKQLPMIYINVHTFFSALFLMNNLNNVIILSIIFFAIYVYFIRSKTCIKSSTIEQFENKDWIDDLFDMKQIITIPSREENVTKFCKSFELNKDIFPAILKKDIIYNNVYNLKIGEIACALSQEQVLKNFISSMHNSIIMFEDDIMSLDNKLYTSANTTLDHVKNYMQKAVDYLPADWDVLYFGRCWDNCRRHIPINKFMVKIHKAMCHHAIAFSRHGAQKILENIKHPLSEPIDHIVSGLCAKGIITCYATAVPIFYQNREELRTTIGNFDKLPICMN